MIKFKQISAAGEGTIRQQLTSLYKIHPWYGVAFTLATIWFLITLLIGFSHQWFVQSRLPPIGLNYMEQADFLFRAGQYEEALAAYRVISGISPDDDTGFLKLAITANRLGLNPEAKIALLRALRLDQKLPTAHFLIGLIYLNEGNTELSIKHNRVAIKQQPVFAQAWNNLGLGLMRTGQSDLAATHFRRALKLDPSLSSARKNLRLLAPNTKNLTLETP